MKQLLTMPWAMAGTILMLLGASIILYCSRTPLRHILRLLWERIADHISMKVLDRVNVPVGNGLLYISYRQYQKSGLRLFVALRDIEGTRFQELSIESVIRLRDAVNAFLNEAETNASLDKTDEIPFTNGNLVRLRRDNTLYLWVKAKGENVETQGNRLPLWLSLEDSGGDNRYKEVTMAAAALIVNALDDFLSLAASVKNIEGAGNLGA